MGLPKRSKQILIGDFVRVKKDKDDCGMPGAPRTYIFIGRVAANAPRITCGSTKDTF